MIDVLNNRIEMLRAEVETLCQRGAEMEASLASLKEEVTSKKACIVELEGIVAKFAEPQPLENEGWTKRPAPGDA